MPSFGSFCPPERFPHLSRSGSRISPPAPRTVRKPLAAARQNKDDTICAQDPGDDHYVRLWRTRSSLIAKPSVDGIPATTYLPRNHILVFLALVGLTSLFGMERGGSLPLSSPRPWAQKPLKPDRKHVNQKNFSVNHQQKESQKLVPLS